MFKKTVHVMGNIWKVIEQTSIVDPLLIEAGGYCDWTDRKIVIRTDLDSNLGNVKNYMMKVARHEIVHAFLFECGLAECAGEAEAWALNEEMVDWYAKVGPVIYKAWKEVKAVEED